MNGTCASCNSLMYACAPSVNDNTMLTLKSFPQWRSFLEPMKLVVELKTSLSSSESWMLVCIHSSFSVFSFSLTPSLTWSQSVSALSKAFFNSA